MSEPTPKFSKGYEFKGPGGQGFRMTKDMYKGDLVVASAFEPFGGATEPLTGEPIPDWLIEQLWPQVW